MGNFIYYERLEDYEEQIRKAKEYKNLEIENEILKENAIHNDKVVDNARWNEMIYKSRIDKAVEYIKSNYIDNPIEFKKDLLKILKGSDKDENN